MENRSPLFREIHKNTWLKRVTNDNRKIQVGPKRPEKFWVVFCVHDDCEPLLEGYNDVRQASSHVPDWTVSLQTTLHISHTLVPSDQEYEFVIKLQRDTIRFHAHSWEIMQEWVDTLRLKLREMKILSPKENVYSKLPEIRPALLPTRDPMSPLPATPPVPAAIVPGIERIIPILNRISTSVTTTTVATSSNSNSNASTLNDSQPSTSSAASTSIVSTSVAPSTSMSNTLSQNLIKMLNDPVTEYSHQVNNLYADSDSSCNTSLYGESVDLPQISIQNHLSSPQENESIQQIKSMPSLATKFAQNALAGPSTSAAARNFNNNESENCSSDSLNVSTSPTPEPIVIPRLQTNRKDKLANNVSIEENLNENNEIDDVEENGASSTNITIIQLSSPIKKESNREITTNDEFKSNVQIIPSNLDTKLPDSPKTTTVHVINDQSSANNIPTTSSAIILNENSTTAENSNHTPVKNVQSFGAVTNVPIGLATTSSSQLHYEQVFVSTSTTTTTVNADSSIPSVTPSSPSPSPKFKFFHKQQKSASQIDMHISRIKLKKAESAPRSNVSITEMPSTSNSTAISFNTQSTASNNVEQKKIGNRPLLTRGLTEAVITRTSRKDGISVQRSTAKNQSQINSVETSVLQSLRQEPSEQRKRSSSTSDTQGNRNRGHTITAPVATNNNANGHQNSNIVNNNASNEFHARRFQPAPQPFHTKEISLHASARMTLREQQVMQLRREMMHPTGVRLQIRRKDCINSIALVDVFGAVWIAGWKQKEHPMLYNAFHIGDQVISIGGVGINNANEAQKTLKNGPGLYVEFIIRRIPFGRVYAIRREVERQCLGLIRDNNTATIVDVVPNSLSARHGLPPKAQTIDNKSFTFWVLTEINGRPLNLFFKDNEVQDRLNAIGKEISILVQPSDLITKLKKQLKSLRGYKEYIVQ